MMPRRESRWNLQWCPKLANRSQPLVGRSSLYYEDMWRRYRCLTSFFPDCVKYCTSGVEMNIFSDGCVTFKFKAFLVLFCTTRELFTQIVSLGRVLAGSFKLTDDEVEHPSSHLWADRAAQWRAAGRSTVERSDYNQNSCERMTSASHQSSRLLQAACTKRPQPKPRFAESTKPTEIL